MPGLTLSSGLDAASFLKGRIDMRCVAAAGHRCEGLPRGMEGPVARLQVATKPHLPLLRLPLPCLQLWRGDHHRPRCRGCALPLRRRAGSLVVRDNEALPVACYWPLHGKHLFM